MEMPMSNTDRGEGKIVTVTAKAPDAAVVQTAGPPGDRGLGDTVARLTHATGLDKLAHFYTQVTGRDCGCKGRQELLNRLIPYGRK
jgi:hypothetical protein